MNNSPIDASLYILVYRTDLMDIDTPTDKITHWKIKTINRTEIRRAKYILFMDKDSKKVIKNRGLRFPTLLTGNL
tara:strand:- start:1446 stop:1670 length:225 start_codon:yes stop_codon:yes gene_type:complete